ncbi:VanZ family protein [Trichococcus patagoniensis]|uniref:VanZ family protein n=1 Tax=Trichococcus patagoniensis TaxID=382641 RepID=A0A2T5IQ54_9LACT|nr:VanZ family protein [Trichococcus patagoniensis]PTQ85953.1 VanZ family protein [Trichococcus patagoniensis]
MLKVNQRKLLILLAVVFWMAIIFKLSAQPGEQSNLLSTKVTTAIVSLAKLFRPDVNVLTLNHFIRKCAHFLAYLVLGIIVLVAVRRIGLTGKKGVGFTLLLCIGYAITNELHQAFVPGRTPNLLDVLIDNSGASLGIGIYVLFVENRWKELKQKLL